MLTYCSYKLQFSHHGSYTSLDLQIIVKMSKNAKFNKLQFSHNGSYTSLDLQIIVKMSKNAELYILLYQAAVFAPW